MEITPLHRLNPLPAEKRITMVESSAWRKSSFSNGSGGNQCVEVRTTKEHVLVRDTKDKGTGVTLMFTKAEWSAFLAGVRNGEFDA